ncbi:MAG: DUF642 domain-containing protein [Anaerolinea sp.]|nr:DUF642 domain-containing protein [Anaerolinea sp.]
MNFVSRSFRLVLFAAVVLVSSIHLQVNHQVAYAASCEQLINTGFEESPLVETLQIRDAGLVPGWDTTATDNMIEQWMSGFENIPAYAGNQFAELNANEIAALHQDFATVPGTTITVSFAHRGRRGLDSAVLEMGVPGAALTEILQVETDTVEWKVYSATYTIPEGQTITRIQFRSVSSSSTDGSVGNLLDEISITRESETCDEPPVYEAACALLDNTGFEESVLQRDYEIRDAGLVPGWDTSAADNMIEQWRSGFNGVVAYEGNQFAELNANEPSLFYQDFASTPDSTVTIEFAHRGREGVDQAVLEMGVPGAAELTQILEMSTGTEGWQGYTATYVIPEGQTITRMQFRAITEGSLGNFIDGISLSCS